MSTRGAYLLPDGTLVRTQGEVPKGSPVNKVGIPVGHQELIDYINGIIARERAAQVPPIDSHVERQPFDGPFEQQEEAVDHQAPASPPPPATLDPFIADRNSIEEVWPNLPLQFRFHLCSLTMEDARNVDWAGTTPAKAPQRLEKK